MYIVGIDPGLLFTGVAVSFLENNEYKIVFTEEINSKKKKEISDRLLYIYNSIEIIIDKYQPKILCVEQSFVNINPSTSLKLNMVVGNILLLGAKKNIEVKIFSPNQIKKFITGSGFASKEKIKLFIQSLTNYKTNSSHINDAIALSILGK
ncbi:hypothetical protein AB836_01590 [Rickettsiales bacterium (ex Bugula neritina AB1)]|nr:hypothetical protein AB836_01590 [Rickettsiales bacterium (ex Bugula neritina AB1)]